MDNDQREENKWVILPKKTIDEDDSPVVIFTDGCTYSKVGLLALAQAVERGVVWWQKYKNKNSKTTTYKFFFKYKF